MANRNKIALPGSERPHAPGSKKIDPLQPSEHIHFTVLLRQRPDTPALSSLEHWQHTAPADREYLSPEEFFEKHGASEEDLAAVVDFLRSADLNVTESHAGRRRIAVEGTAERINEAFGITLEWYRVPHRQIRRRMEKSGEPAVEVESEVREHIHRGYDGPLHLPSVLIGVVTAIIGLDNRRLGGPAGTGTGDPAGAQYLSPVTVAQLYNFPTSSAAGQTIGLFEAADSGAAYLQSDINQFVASLPAGSNTPANMVDIGLLGYTNNTSLVTGGGPIGGGVLEATLDVAVVAAVAQGSNINVYFTEDSENGWATFFDRAIFPKPGDNAPSVLSASWVLTFSDDSGTIGDPTVSGTLSNTLSGYMQMAAMRGITVLMAIGDWGSGNQVVDTHCHVSYPNSDPWATGCGGTIIGSVSATTPVTFQEFAWSDGNTASQFQSGVYEATGGGVSDVFQRPPYQIAAGILPVSKNDGAIRRGVPDVAGMVGMDGFFFNGSGGPGTNTLFGTSAVSPLYAGLVAVINGILGHDVGFLNPTLYKYGPEICNDITFGNNDSSYVPDAPFYTAGIGWDPCTGWGSINGRRLLAALAPAAILETAIPRGGFAPACLGSFTEEVLTINNSGFAPLLISSIISSSFDFLAPAVSAFPLEVAPGASIDLVMRFNPATPGPKIGTITIHSNTLSGVNVIKISGTAQMPHLALAIAGQGDFGPVCIGSFRDEPLILNNSGKCQLLIDGITSSSPDFLPPEVLSYPLSIASGDSLALPIRFAPESVGGKTATLTVTSNDPAGPREITITGEVPSGKLAVTGSLCFGGVKACHSRERTLTLCNVGDCRLTITSLAFKRKSPFWKLVNNPFPATLHPGSCLSVVVRYKAAEKCPRCCELVITSDDPNSPVKILDVLANTIWKRECSCQKKGCGCKQCPEDCCGDEDSGADLEDCCD